MSYEAYDLYKKKKQPQRDEIVQELISDYFKKNVAVLSDGILNNIPIITASARSLIERHYNIDSKELDTLKKNKEFKVFKRDESITSLKLGLLISYIETGKPIYLNYFSVLIYSSLYFKYFRNGNNKAVLKYTIETQDNRTDFKRYEMSLITVVTKKTEVIIDFFKSSRYIEKDGKVSDKSLRLMLQAISTRYNNMLRTICSKYMDNMKDDSVKVMMQHSKTLDGKDIISPMNVIESIRDASNDNLRIPSFKALNMSGMNVGNFIRYKNMFVLNFNNDYNEIVKINNMIFDEYISRYPNVSLNEFKTKFTSVMSSARNIKHINDAIDGLFKKNLTEDLKGKVSQDVYRKAVYKFMLANIFLSTLEVLKTQ